MEKARPLNALLISDPMKSKSIITIKDSYAPESVN